MYRGYQNSWISSDYENLRHWTTYVCIPRHFGDYACTIHVWNQYHTTGREEWIDHWRAYQVSLEITYTLLTSGISITLQKERNGLTIGENLHFSQF